MPTMTEDVIPRPGDPSGYYQVLGVAGDSTFDAIKRAAKQRLKEWHPDHASGDANRRAREERSKLISQAKFTLGDPSRRRHYDSTVFESPEDMRRRAEEARRAQDEHRAERERRESARRRDEHARQERERARREEEHRRAAEDAARRRAAEVEARLRAANEDAFWEMAQRVAYSLWTLAFLAMVPMFTIRAIELPFENQLLNPIAATIAIFGLAVALPILGAVTRVFDFVGTFSRRLAIVAVALQLILVFLLIVLAPLLAFLVTVVVTTFKLLVYVLFLAGSGFTFRVILD